MGQIRPGPDWERPGPEQHGSRAGASAAWQGCGSRSRRQLQQRLCHQCASALQELTALIPLRTDTLVSEFPENTVLCSTGQMSQEGPLGPVMPLLESTDNLAVCVGRRRRAVHNRLQRCRAAGGEGEGSCPGADPCERSGNE